MPEPVYKPTDKFDYKYGEMDGLPDVTKTKPTTIMIPLPVLGVLTYTVQTFRQRESGDTIFLQLSDSEGRVRIFFPPEIADTIARQRDALTTKVRKRIGKEKAAERKARGELPGFMKGKKPKTK